MGRERAASRSTGPEGNAVVLGPETRTIYYAVGIEGHVEDVVRVTDRGREIHTPLFEVWRILTEQRTRAFNRAMRSGDYNMRCATRWTPIHWDSEQTDEWRYRSQPQGVDYVIRRIKTRTAFKAALEETGAIVLYDGHARYGRGPCFGRPGAAPGEDWENGTSDAYGIFRMGYPFIATDVEDIEHHGYTPDLAGPPVDAIDAGDCDPDVRPHLGRARPRALRDLRPRLTHYSANPTVLSYRAYDEGRLKDHVVHRAGWQNTRAPSALDLGGTTVRCRAFFHLGCSTYRHNYRVMRRSYGWTRQGDDRYAYWTTDVSLGPHTVLMVVYHMLRYGEPSATLPWGPWLEHVVRRTNADLRVSGLGYRLI